MTSDLGPLPIERLSIPNPFFEGRNSVYVIKDDPVTLVDTGVATQRAFDRLVEGLRSIGLHATDVKRVLLTHKHIDHIGNAWRFSQDINAEVWIHVSEVKSVTDVDPKGERFREVVDRRLSEWGVGNTADLHSKNKMPLWELESTEASMFEDGDVIGFDHGQLEVMHTPGHSQGSCCFVTNDRTHIFAGDHVLPTMSPNIGAGDLRGSEMLRKFLASLRRVESLPETTLAHPGHGESFHQVGRRCRELLNHHMTRLARIREILTEQPQSVYQIAEQLFGSLDGIHVMLGCAEAFAHLEYLAGEDHASCESNGWVRGDAP